MVGFLELPRRAHPGVVGLMAPLLLRDIQPDWDNGCPCVHGEIDGVRVDGYCWRTGPQPAGLGVVVWGSRVESMLLGVQVALAQLDLWEGMQVFIYMQEDTENAVVYIPENHDA